MLDLTPIGCGMRLSRLFGVVGGLGVLLSALTAAFLSSACASTGAVPRPFPAPGGSSASPGLPGPGSAPGAAPAPATVRPGAADMYAVTGTALSLRGSPYRNGGTDPDGFDCSGFTQYVFGQHGVALPRDVREQFRLGSSVRPQQLAPGDLLFFTTVAPGASHVGIALGGDEFIHAPSSSGVVRVEHLSAAYWSQRFVGARRVD
jgi:cell wall-associated NlpC family hydrolase